MSLIVGHKSRKLTYNLIMLDAAGDTITPSGSDVVRVKIGIRGSAPLLDLDTLGATDNGSIVDKNTPISGTQQLNIESGDMDMPHGTYTLEMLLYDADDSAIKHVDHQVFVVLNTMTGDIGDS